MIWALGADAFPCIFCFSCFASLQHGLTFTTFQYSDLKISHSTGTINEGSSDVAVTVSCTVTNNGTRGFSGTEIPQLYISFPKVSGEPPKQLKDWCKLPSLAPGASATATFTLDARSFSIWDVESHRWKVVRGDFGVLVGASSEDIRLIGTTTVTPWWRIVIIYIVRLE